MKKRKEKRKYVAGPGIEPRTPDLRVRCPTDCATRPGLKEREMAEAKEARERETVLKEREMEEDKEAHERELQKLQIQQSIEEKKHVFETERLAAEQNVKPAVQSKEDQSNVSA